MKALKVKEKKQYETPIMELLVVTGREVMYSHDNAYRNIKELLHAVSSYAPPQGYYDED